MLVTTPRAVELSIDMGVGGCGWPSSLRRCHCNTTALALMYKANSALAAEDMTGLIICLRDKMAPLFQGGDHFPIEKDAPQPCCMLLFQTDRMRLCGRQGSYCWRDILLWHLDVS